MSDDEQHQLEARVAAIEATLDVLLAELRAALTYTQESNRRLREPIVAAPPLAGSLRNRRHRLIRLQRQNGVKHGS